MEELLKKIRRANVTQKCQLAAEIYLQIDQELQRLDLNLNNSDQILDQIEEVLVKLEDFLNPDIRETKRIKENLERDYDETLELWKFYELLDADGKNYTADYAEFAGKRFAFPSKKAIMESLLPKQLALYKEMEMEGLRPKLQITPMAFRINTLKRKLDAKKADSEHRSVRNDIKDEELLYSPGNIKAIDDGKQIEIIGGKTKTGWINLNQGILIDIVSMKQRLKADPEIQDKNESGKVNYNAIQAEKYYAKLKAKGYKPMSFESYLIAEMRAQKETGTDLQYGNCENYCLLMDSNFSYGKHLAVVDRFTWLGRRDTDKRTAALRMRSTIRIRIKDEEADRWIEDMLEMRRKRLGP